MATVLKPSIEGGRKLREVAALLRSQSRGLPHRLGEAIEAEGKPTLVDLKQAARRVAVTGRRTGAPRRFVHEAKAKHLRERMADATSLEVVIGEQESRVSFHTDSTLMGKARVVPRYIDLGEPWRHPIMGRRSRWADSVGAPWFFPPIKKHLPGFRKRIDAVLDEIVAKVERS